MQYYIGIDLGTSGAKLMLTDETLQSVRTITKTYPLDFTADGKSEQDPADWLEAVKEGLQELAACVPAGAVAGVGVGGQMHGLVMLDENDRVLRPAILWNDTRTGEETQFLNREFGVEKLARLTGNMAFAGFTAPKILWVKAHEPEIFARCKKICLPKDYINYMLTGVFATDVSDASGMLLFDVKNRTWSEEMLSVCGVTRGMLPQVFESAAPIGKLKPSFGLGENVTVCAGAGDNAAAAIGTGTVNAGTCNISLGTSGTVFIPTDTFVQPENPALHSFCHANGKYHLMGCILSAASCDKWLNETLFDTADYGAVIPCLNADTASKKLYFLPYLAGERCPHNDESIRGAFVGLSHDTSRADLRLAVFEGVSFAIKDCLALVPQQIGKATVCGGGTKSRVWMDVLANVLGIELEIIRTEGPALGGAALACAANGLHVAITNDVGAIVRPDDALKKIYAQKYQVWKKLYPALSAI
ncbi:MAG: xylulokinase [Clostridia bacterium]|nr:xylulokinase [Clostridia bacterium]